MLRRTYGDLKAALGRTAGATGMNTADPRVMYYVNLAIEELMNEHDFPSTVDRLRFRLTDDVCHFVLPSDYDRMLYCTVNHTPIQMQSPWYEFVSYGLDMLNMWGSGNAEDGNNNRYEGVLDKDDLATFREVPRSDGPWYPRIYGTVDERVAGARPEITLQGYDADGNWIRTADGAGGYYDGVKVAINGDTYPFWIQSAQSMSYVTQVIKPMTKGSVRLYMVNGAGTQEYIGQYAPKDTTPFYRQYSIPTLSWFYQQNGRSACILARCRRRFVPITRDEDFLLISNLPALASMMQAMWYRESKDPTNYAAFKAIAVDILKKEAKAYVGLQRQKPLITVSEGTGMRHDGVYIL